MATWPKSDLIKEMTLDDSLFFSLCFAVRVPSSRRYCRRYRTRPVAQARGDHQRIAPATMGAFSSKATATVSNFRPPVYNSMVDAIGNTPLILLKGPSERTGCKIYGKAEFLNPGGSVKDRAAKSLIETLEKEGKLKPGVSTVVEGTAGNTGIGLSYVCNAKGYKTVIVIPRTQSQEKKDTLRQAGASLVEVDAMGYKFPSEPTT
jgi:threonine synthase